MNYFASYCRGIISDVEVQIKKMNEKLYSLNGITMSYGCCEVDFSNEKPFEEAYKNADKLMYSDKEQKKLKFDLS